MAEVRGMNLIVYSNSSIIALYNHFRLPFQSQSISVKLPFTDFPPPSSISQRLNDHSREEKSFHSVIRKASAKS